MNNTGARMTFRFGEKDQGDNSFTSPTTGERKFEQRSTACGRRPTELEKINLPTDNQNPDRNEHAKLVMKRNDDKVERLNCEADQSIHNFPQNGYLLASTVEDVAGGSLGDQGRLMWYSTHTRSWKPPIWKVVASVAGALATGTLFGFLVLSFFQGEVSMPNANDAALAFTHDQRVKGNEVTANVISHNKVNVKDPEKKPNATEGSGAPTAAGLYIKEVNIPGKVFYVLQYGVFTQADGAQKAASRLRELGMAAVVKENLDQHRVYTAIASSKEDAMELSLLLKNKQVDLYVRPLHRPAITELLFREGTAVVERFIAQSDIVNAWLMSQSIAYLRKGAAAAFSLDLTEQLRREHSKWTQQMNIVEKGIPEWSTTKWRKMIQGMNTAISALNEYNKQPLSAHLWDVQQAVMIYQAAQKEWLGTMKV